MVSKAVLGCQWGDEGKGKIVDLLAKDADLIVRFQGGANAGHTVVVDGKEYKFHQVPSGLLYEDKTGLIADGCALDLDVFGGELKLINERSRVFVGDRAHIVFPHHKKMDEMQEKTRKKGIGTTRRGIGPCYSQRAERVGLRVCDLDDGKIEDRIDEIYPFIEEFTTRESLLDYCIGRRELIEGRTVSTPNFLAENRGQDILFEGAQGTMLDVNYGTYPFTTSSNTTVGAICTGCGVPPSFIDEVIGAAKAYTTRVGGGPLPTELKDEMGDHLRERGGEYGTTTGRPRRCGWLDLVVVKHSLMLNGFSSLVLTKLDVLSGLKEIKACVGYDCQGEEMESFPADLSLLDRCSPLYERFKGWDQIGYRLPKNARDYIDYIESFLGIGVEMVSVGRGREEILTDL
jgi:adenylosuccinate synthase